MASKNGDIDMVDGEDCLSPTKSEAQTSNSPPKQPARGRSCIEQNSFDAYASHTNSDGINFNIPEYKQDAFQMMMLLKRNHILTDVKLEVGKEMFPVHRVVLAAASPYFKAMFTGGLRECDTNTVKLQGVNPSVMRPLLDFMYSGEILITENLVCQLISAATMFQMTYVINACCTFLEHQLDAYNAIGIANFAQQHGCTNLFKKANTFIEQHFQEVSLEEEFLQLTECQLINLIQRDELNVYDEKDVYNPVLKWVRHDEEKRKSKMETILQTVRCPQLSPKFLDEQVKNCQLIHKVPACREYLAKIFEDLTLHKPPAQKARTPNAPCVIYIVGGFSSKRCLNTLECYDVEESKWTQLSQLPVARSGLGAAYLQGNFYAVGGRSIVQQGVYRDSNWVDSFDPITNLWVGKSVMNYRRNRLGATVLDKQLYAVGGADGMQCHKSVERFDPEDNKWILVKPMTKARMGVGLAVVNRLLYAIGGYDGQERLNSIECYHPEKDQWKFIAPMKIPRSGSGVCYIDKYIFVIGGYDGKHQLSSVEKYDTESNTWHFAPPLKIARSAMTVSVWDCKIFVMGGYDGSNFLPSVEIFDFNDNKWFDGKPLPWGRSGHASASSFHPCLLHIDSK